MEMTTAEAFKRFRKEFGLSQQKVAEKMGITQAAFSVYEAKGNSPTAGTLKKMAKIFNVSIDYLLGLTDNPRPVNQILEEIGQNQISISQVSPSDAKPTLENLQAQIYNLQDQINAMQDKISLAGKFFNFNDDESIS